MERFRQTVSEQLTEEQIPLAARPRRPIQRRPSEAAAPPPAREQPAPASNQFANFGANRAVVPERRPRPSAARPGTPRPPPAPASPSSFASSIAFNQNTGTFQTSLQQNVEGGAPLNIQNAAPPRRHHQAAR